MIDLLHKDNLNLYLLIHSYLIYSKSNRYRELKDIANTTTTAAELLMVANLAIVLLISNYLFINHRDNIKTGEYKSMR